MLTALSLKISDLELLSEKKCEKLIMSASEEVLAAEDGYFRIKFDELLEKFAKERTLFSSSYDIIDTIVSEETYKNLDKIIDSYADWIHEEKILETCMIYESDIDEGNLEGITLVGAIGLKYTDDGQNKLSILVKFEPGYENLMIEIASDKEIIDYLSKNDYIAASMNLATIIPWYEGKFGNIDEFS